MKKSLVVGVGLLSFGCALEAGDPEAMENVDTVDQPVVTRAKTVSFLPARICDAYIADIDAWNWSCFADTRGTQACTEGLQLQVAPKRPIPQYKGTGNSIYFMPGGGQSWYNVDDEVYVANVDTIACYNVHQSNEYPLIAFREGLKPGRKVLSVETIFEHIRSITVRATADIAFLAYSDPVYTRTVELAVQTLDADGAWVDRAVRGSKYAFNSDTSGWEGEPNQILTISTKVPANEPVRMLLRTGSGAVSGSDVRFSVRDAELRGEECVPDNSGGCLE